MAHKKTSKNPKGAGRPKGSKNKSKLSGAIKRARSLDESEFRRLRGRPKGTHKMKEFVVVGYIKKSK